MAELIILLLATLGELLATGVGAGELAARMEAAVLAEPPVQARETQVLAEGVSAGGVEQIAFVFTDLQLDGLLIDHATITVSSVKADENGRLSLESITWIIQIAENALTAALADQADALSGTTVSISENGIALRGAYPLWKLRLPFEVQGNLVVEEQAQLVFHIKDSGVSGVRVPARLNRLIEREVNPVYDLAGFAKRSEKEIEQARKQLGYEFELRVEKLVSNAGHIIVEGSA